jgi:DNA invertase Pin-like site-specific DNA recombinase
MPEMRFVGYCRASTPAQVLGLALQRDVINRYVEKTGATLLDVYEDIQRASRRADDFAKHQPELARALLRCRQSSAALLVARLDRLSRSVALVAKLLEEGPALVVAEMPQASKLMLHVYAALAEENRERMSRRVRAGIAAAMAAGRKRNPHSKALAVRLRKEAMARAAAVRPVMEGVRQGRAMTLPEVAEELNARGLRTARGEPYTHPTTFKLWRRFHRKWHTRRFPGRPGSTDSIVFEARMVAHLDLLRSIVERLRREGVTAQEEITRRLNEAGYRTVTGRPWHRNMTYRLLRRLAGKPV